eukprot:147048_1
MFQLFHGFLTCFIVLFSTGHSQPHTIFCNQPDLCANTTVICPVNTECEVVCSDSRSCMKATIIAPVGGTLKVHCVGSEDSCHTASIVGPIDNSLTVQCTNNYACYLITINAASSSSLTVSDCVTGVRTCLGMTILCPININGVPQCHLMGDSSFGTWDTDGNPMRLYAKYGFKDLDITAETDSDTLGMMYCTNDYTVSCSIDESDWSCANNGDLTCENPPTHSPTQTPTIFPSDSPSKYPSHIPSISPTNNPLISPTSQTIQPSYTPSNIPTKYPTHMPSTHMPSKSPSIYPSKYPTHVPSTFPSISPSMFPTRSEQGHVVEIITTETDEQKINLLSNNSGNHIIMFIIVGVVICCVLLAIIVFIIYKKRLKIINVDTKIKMENPLKDTKEINMTQRVKSVDSDCDVLENNTTHGCIGNDLLMGRNGENISMDNENEILNEVNSLHVTVGNIETGEFVIEEETNNITLNGNHNVDNMRMENDNILHETMGNVYINDIVIEQETNDIVIHGDDETMQ